MARWRLIIAMAIIVCLYSYSIITCDLTISVAIASADINEKTFPEFAKWLQNRKVQSKFNVSPYGLLGVGGTAIRDIKVS